MSSQVASHSWVSKRGNSLVVLIERKERRPSKIEGLDYAPMYANWMKARDALPPLNNKWETVKCIAIFLHMNVLTLFDAHDKNCFHIVLQFCLNTYCINRQGVPK